MEGLIDIMYKKRFNLMSSEQKCKNYCCIDNTSFYHIACCFTGTKNIRTLSFGQNYFPIQSENYKIPTCSIHAERDAINKLPKLRKKIKVDMLVLRFTRTKKLTISMPCHKCINNMQNLFPKKGYIVKNIYYSDYDGTIRKTNVNKLSKIKCECDHNYSE